MKKSRAKTLKNDEGVSKNDTARSSEKFAAGISNCSKKRYCGAGLMANVALERFIDRYIGGALCLGYSAGNIFRGKKLPPREEIKNILVVRLWTLGETLLTLPMMEKLREEFPNAKITVLARNRNRGIFKYVDFVDDVLLFESENFGKLLGLHGHFDLAIDTEPYLRVSGLLTRFLGRRQIGFDHSVRGLVYSNKVHYNNNKHCAEIMCDLLRPLDVKYKPAKLVKLRVNDDALKTARTKLEKLFGTSLDDVKVVGIHPSTAESATYRAWTKQNFAELIGLLDKDTRVVLTGTKAEHKFNEDILKMSDGKAYNLAGLLTFDEFIAIFDLLNVYVSNDTGPMHLSAGQGCKTIGLFGPNLPKRFGPYPLDGKQNFALYHGEKLPCSPCILVHEGKFKKCQRLKDGTGECMTLIQPEEVAELI